MRVKRDVPTSAALMDFQLPVALARQCRVPNTLVHETALPKEWPAKSRRRIGQCNARHRASIENARQVFGMCTLANLSVMRNLPWSIHGSNSSCT